jgi:hypothetical protein
MRIDPLNLPLEEDAPRPQRTTTPQSGPTFRTRQEWDARTALVPVYVRAADGRLRLRGE